APRVHGQLRQTEVRHVDVLEIPFAGDPLAGSIQIPGKTVERALQVVGSSRVVAQRTAPVQAGVVERLDPLRRCAHDEHGQLVDVVHPGVTDVGYVLDPAGDLPTPGPDSLLLP